MTPLAATAGEQQSHVATKRRGMTIECCGKTEIVCALLPGPLVGSRSSSWPISTYRMARESSDPNSRRSDTPRHVRPALEDALKAAWLRAQKPALEVGQAAVSFCPNARDFLSLSIQRAVATSQATLLFRDEHRGHRGRSQSAQITFLPVRAAPHATLPRTSRRRLES